MVERLLTITVRQAPNRDDTFHHYRHLLSFLKNLNMDTVVHALSPEDNLRAAYHTLAERVATALRTQVGDTERLNETKSQVFLLLEAAEQVRNLFTVRK